MDRDTKQQRVFEPMSRNGKDIKHFVNLCFCNLSNYMKLRQAPEVATFSSHSANAKNLSTVIPGGFESSNYLIERKWAVSTDGTRVPISILYKKNLVKLDGFDPLLLSKSKIQSDKTGLKSLVFSLTGDQKCVRIHTDPVRTAALHKLTPPDGIPAPRWFSQTEFIHYATLSDGISPRNVVETLTLLSYWKLPILSLLD
ncbi:hypothetical protein KSP39_PZI011419 [Platanthera zijinensis]|uniref:Uncharacterized protein n=1 Tax=Platanthera zijinensis TaxID=2320716 RepID=A0AAP0BH65_9ASPA